MNEFEDEQYQVPDETQEAMLALSPSFINKSFGNRSNINRYMEAVADHEHGLHRFELLDKADFHIDAVDSEGNFIHHYAAEFGNLETLKFIIENYSNHYEIKHRINNQGQNLLFAAAKNLHEPCHILNYLIYELGFNPFTKDSKRNTITHIAAQFGLPEVVEQIGDFNTNYRNKDGETPFILAALNQREPVKVMTALMKNRVFRKLTRPDRKGAIHYAVVGGLPETVDYLIDIEKGFYFGHYDGLAYHFATENIEHGYDISLKLPNYTKLGEVNNLDYNKETVLHRAARFSNLKLIKLYLECGFDINAQTMLEETPFILAAKSPNPSPTLKLLAERGADIHACDKLGRNALHHAAAQGKPGTIRTLVGMGLDLESETNDNKTPVIGVGYNKEHAYELIQELIDLGVDLKKKDHRNLDLFSIALANCDLKVIKMLINELGFSIYEKLNLERSPLIVAMFNEEHGYEIAKFLIDSGINIHIADKHNMNALVYAMILKNKYLL